MPVTPLTRHYKIPFSILWIASCLVYPLWALPVSVVQRSFIYFGMVIYFFLSVRVLTSWFNPLSIEKPFIVTPGGMVKHLGENIWLLIVCVVALVLHIPSLTLPISNFGDEPIHLQGGLWVYDFFGSSWHGTLQVAVWCAVIIFVACLNGNIRAFLVRTVKNAAGTLGIQAPSPRIYISAAFCLSIAYFLLFKNITYEIGIVRYPPVSKFLYLISYLLFGITHRGPRAIQVIFYILGGVYLYRTINLFQNKDVSLLGASIYLFSPVVFFYAQVAELELGVVFFLTIISFYFLRFLKNNDNRDLVLTSFLIGAGFLYKKYILLMFFLCCAYLVFSTFKNRHNDLIKNLKVLFLSLVPVIPWMMIGKFYNWRSYSFIPSHFTSIDIISSYLLMIPAQASWAFFILFLVSIPYVLLKKRNGLSLFFALLFTAYYFLYTADFTAAVPIKVHRFSVAFYPAIAVFLAQFLSDMVRRIKWRYSFKVVFAILTAYLILLCLNPSMRADLLLKRTLHFPSEQAMLWVKHAVRNGDKVLLLRILPSRFYMDKFDIDRGTIVNFWYEMAGVSTPGKLKEFCRENNIQYVMFSLNPTYDNRGLGWPGGEVFQYIINNRDHEFDKVREFSIDDNHIYVYRTSVSAVP